MVAEIIFFSLYQITDAYINSQPSCTWLFCSGICLHWDLFALGFVCTRFYLNVSLFTRSFIHTALIKHSLCFTRLSYRQCVLKPLRLHSPRFSIQHFNYLDIHAFSTAHTDQLTNIDSRTNDSQLANSMMMRSISPLAQKKIPL